MENNKSLGSDNHSGIHPELLQCLIDTNHGHSPSYGTDTTTEQAKELFRKHFGPCDVHFVFNGTAANVLSLKSFISSYHSVFCAETSHLNLDECSAPEAIVGCKLWPLPSPNGKIDLKDVENALVRLGDQHYPQPKMISITQPTELGTVYSVEELKAIGKFCRKHNLYFHVDGARFIYAAYYLNKTFKELTIDVGVDVLSFGGTKNGLLFGEAVVIFNDAGKADFKYIRKQNLQLPSKMRFLSAQFTKLLENDLWKRIAQHCHNLAKELESQLVGIPQVEVMHKVQSNSVFVKIPKSWVKPLKSVAYFYVWDEKEWIMRWMTSFDTSTEDINKFVHAIKELAYAKNELS